MVNPTLWKNLTVHQQERIRPSRPMTYLNLLASNFMNNLAMVFKIRYKVFFPSNNYFSVVEIVAIAFNIKSLMYKAELCTTKVLWMN